MKAFDWFILVVALGAFGLFNLSIWTTPTATLEIAKHTNPEGVERWRARNRHRIYVFLICMGIFAWRHS